MQSLADDDPAEIGGYRLEARLGTGGMGRVYLASTAAGRPVALKAVRPELSDDREFRARFRQEVEAAKRVHGLYTAELIDADPDATPPWLVTAYVPGPSLEEAIEANGPMPASAVLRLIAGVAEALQAIHAAGVVHRDLKPSNVLLAQDGPRVIDFGIARALEAASLTRGDIMMGSPHFLAPEQILDLPISPAIDVFALGSLAVYAAAGRPPFGQGQLPAITHRVVHEPPNLEGCPAQLLTLIEACLEKQAKARPAPGRIIEFCMTRAAEMADSSQPWLAWSLAGTAPPGTAPPPGNRRPQPPPDAPDAEADAAGTTAGSSGGNPGEERAGTGKAERGRLRFVAALAATALAAAVIATVATLHLATGGNTALGEAARRVTSTGQPGTPTVRVSPSPAGRAAAAPTAPAAYPSASASRVATSPPAQPRGKAPTPLVLLSVGHTATASSIEGYPWAASNAVDGNLKSRWSSAWSDPQWLEVDLGATHAIRKIVLDWERAYATAFRIQASADGTNWTDIYSTAAGTGGDQTIQATGTGRYIRMYGTHRVSSYGYSLWEFQVFGY
jgi:hypothetical protein